MLDAKNFGTITGGLVADPEIMGNSKNIMKLRLGVDRAGQDSKDPSNNSGYFNVTYFMGDDPGSKFIRSQLEQGNLKKGSAVSIVYRLSQDRWEQDGQNRSNIVLIAESISYYGFKDRSGESSSESSSPRPQQAAATTRYASAPDEF